MIPFEFNYGKPKPGLRSIRDFDLPYAYRDLSVESGSPEKTVWKTRLWVHVFMGTLSGILGGVLWIAARYDPIGRQVNLLAEVVVVVLGLLLLVTMLLFVYLSQARRRLVLDHTRRELLFYPFWFSTRPHRRINVDAIQALTRQEIGQIKSDDEPGHTYRILVAELTDGRRASIAIDSPASIETALKKMLSPS